MKYISFTRRGGATVLSGNFFGSGGAVTLSSFINGSHSLAADPNNVLFQHEYGHYLQSQSMGPAYLSRIGIPSIMGAASFNDGNHDFQPYEQDANRRAFLYFNKHVEGFYQTEEQYNSNPNIGWNFYENPLDVNHTATRGEYYDYNDPNDLILINSLTLNAKWYDYIPLIMGIPNGIYYNNHRIR